MKHAFNSIVMLSLVVISGCVSDRALLGADALPAAQRVRLIDVPGSGLGEAIYIAAVDGKWRGLGHVKVYELPPGPHTLAISVAAGLNGTGVSLRYDFAAGGTYSVHGEIGRPDHGRTPFRVWIVDDATGRELQPIQ